MNLRMIASWALGLFLLSIPGLVDWTGDLWIYGKLALVVALTGVAGLLT